MGYGPQEWVAPLFFWNKIDLASGSYVLYNSFLKQDLVVHVILVLTIYKELYLSKGFLIQYLVNLGPGREKK